jgi:glutathione S-transferase
MLDRIFDNNVMAPTQAVVAEHLPFITQTPDERRIERARSSLDKIYPWLDARLTGREWAAGEDFTLADCAGAPSLFYADWVQPIPDELTSLKAYRARVLARPSVARAVDEARPYRHLFPLGAPDRD